MFIHAHPDDEAILTSGTMARARASGIRTVLMMCTDGAAGITDETLLADGQDLSDLRRAELEASAEVLHVDEVIWLGFEDSGLDGMASPNGFASCARSTVSAVIADSLSALHPDLVTVYDRHGGYGHPDHVRVHEAGHAAVREAGLSCEVWESTVDRDFLRESATLATQLGVPVAPDFVEWIGAEDHFLARGEIDIRVDVNAYLAQRRASLLAHHSQGASPDGSSRMLSIAAALPDEVFGLAFGVEWYRRTGAAGPVEAVLSA